MTAKEFHALQHNYKDEIVNEARFMLQSYLEQDHSGVKVYIAEPHGGYVFLAARYLISRKHSTEMDMVAWVEVVDGKCGKLHCGYAQYGMSQFASRRTENHG